MPARVSLLILLYALASSLSADEAMTPEQLEKWFSRDDEASTTQISEGALRFISPPAKAVLHSINTLTIDDNSIDNGWVGLTQCYRHLDAVPVAEVVYRYRQMRNLQIIATHNIGSAKLQGQSVQLMDVTKDAELCIKAEVRIFYQNPDLSYSLVNGPFHRRFLDGYYPYHVTLNIQYPGKLLLFEASRPAAQSGFEVRQAVDGLTIDSYFEGILNTEVIFREK